MHNDSAPKDAALLTMHAQLAPDSHPTPGLHKALAAKLMRHALGHGLHPMPVPGVMVARSNSPSRPLPAVYEPSLCIVVQGRKRAVVGEEVYVYDPLKYLVVSVTLPARTRIVEATPDDPYLCLRIGMDAGVIGELLEQLGPEVISRPTAGRGLFLAEMTAPMLDAVSRLVNLLDRPREAAVLAPLVLKEIYYRVLTGTLGHRLRDLCTADSHAQRIARVIRLLKTGYTDPVRVEDLAAAAHMSVSSLHHRFKAVTAMSPMQYLKQLRLHEARRLMLTEGLDASAACYRVGYESPSQFSREYRRLFGAPPRREVERFRAHAPSPNTDSQGAA